MHQINGVAIPGQWLTPHYIEIHQRRALRGNREPTFARCENCGPIGPHHECPFQIDWDTIRDALPWRKNLAA